MDFNVNTSSSAGMYFLMVIGVLWGVAVTIFYMMVAWRAMRAHELISQILMRDLQLKYGKGDSTQTG